MQSLPHQVKTTQSTSLASFPQGWRRSSCLSELEKRSHLAGGMQCRGRHEMSPPAWWLRGTGKTEAAKEMGRSMKTSHGLLIAAAVALVGVTGCATKNYVKSQTAPIIDHTNTLDQKTADNNRALHDVDDRATTGIKQAQSAADAASQNAQNATKAAGDADMAANDAVHRADSLD